MDAELFALYNPDYDTKFAGFAKLLFAELNERDFIWVTEDEISECLTLLARRAYDFAMHVNGHGACEESIYEIADMVAWPERTWLP